MTTPTLDRAIPLVGFLLVATLIALIIVGATIHQRHSDDVEARCTPIGETAGGIIVYRCDGGTP